MDLLSLCRYVFCILAVRQSSLALARFLVYIASFFLPTTDAVRIRQQWHKAQSLGIALDNAERKHSASH